MKSLFFIFCLLGMTASLTLSEVRNLYKDAAKSKENALQFYEHLAPAQNSTNAVMKGYSAAALTLKARYTKGIKNKKKLFQQAVMILEKEIKNNPSNTELRLIRLSIQENIPKVLKYKQNIEEDKQFIQKKYKQIKSRNFKSYVKVFIQQSKSFTEREKSVLLGMK